MSNFDSAIDLPPLEHGDRMTRDEFERRYDAMPELKKAELIEGVVYLPPPPRLRQHAEPHAAVVGWLGIYAAFTPGASSADNSSVRLDLDNEPQPDAILYVEPDRGGQARISEDDYLEGAPELAAEITSSSVSYDLGAKLDVYRRNGVREYVVWRVQDEAIDWFVLRGSTYEKLEAGPDDIVRSEVFPGLWLDVQLMLSVDLKGVLDVLRQGVESPEHGRFAEVLQART